MVPQPTTLPCALRRYCDGEKINPELLTDLHVLNPCEYGKMVFEISLYMCAC
jgi:hypothetical protein